ncbi:hypothetical protein AC1031_009909 [Aphanomyces cochlioides]|nr:hypothetical protein AC1031_009909 [Aphanomyces cochlioides]
MTICLPKILPVSNGRIRIHIGVSGDSGLTGGQIALIVVGVIVAIWILICICQACQATPAEENNFEALPVTPATTMPVPAPQEQGGQVWVVNTQVYVDDVTRDDGNGGSTNLSQRNVFESVFLFGQRSNDDRHVVLSRWCLEAPVTVRLQKLLTTIVAET